MSKQRSALTANTVKSVSEENNGNRLDEQRAQQCAAAMDPILGLIEQLRELPIKNTEPAIIFHPVD